MGQLPPLKLVFLRGENSNSCTVFYFTVHEHSISAMGVFELQYALRFFLIYYIYNFIAPATKEIRVYCRSVVSIVQGVVPISDASSIIICSFPFTDESQNRRRISSTAADMKNFCTELGRKPTVQRIWANLRTYLKLASITVQSKVISVVKNHHIRPSWDPGMLPWGILLPMMWKDYDRHSVILGGLLNRVCATEHTL